MRYTSEMQRDEKMERTTFQQKMLTNKRRKQDVEIVQRPYYLITFQTIFLFSAIEHNNTFIMYTKTATCFGLFYRPSSGNT